MTTRIQGRPARAAFVVFLLSITSASAAADNASEATGGSSPGDDASPAAKALLPTPAPVSAKLTWTTDYMPRGYSKSANDPAVQGSIDFKSSFGLYGGLWASSVDFQDGDQARIEFAPYIGVAAPVTKTLFWNLGFLSYTYPGTPSAFEYDFQEVLASLIYYFGAGDASVSLFYSPDYTFGVGESTYWSLDLNLKLPRDFGLLLHAARLEVEDNTSFFGTPDYNDYRVGLYKSLAGFKLSLDYIASSLSRSECFGGFDICEDRAAFSIQKQF